MKTINSILYLPLAWCILSCESPQSDVINKDQSSASTTRTIAVDSFYLDQNEINSNEWKVFEYDSLQKRSSAFQIELDNAMKNEEIDSFYKKVYQMERSIPGDDHKLLSISDRLFANSEETDLFYFLVFTKSMNGSDGFYSEVAGLSALDFVSRKTEYFADYFNKAPNLTDKDLSNWANSIYGEISISRADEELMAIGELEAVLYENIKETSQENGPIIEKLLDKIKQAHSAN